MQIPDLSLPSGGTVKFRNDDDLTSAEYRRINALYSPDRQTPGEVQNVMAEAAMATLIVEWSITAFPGLPLPAWRQNENTQAWFVDPGGLAGLKMRDAIALDIAVQEFVNYVIRGTRPIPKAPSPEFASSSEVTAE